MYSGTYDDLARLPDIADNVSGKCLCPLGDASLPFMLSAMKHYGRRTPTRYPSPRRHSPDVRSSVMRAVESLLRLGIATVPCRGHGNLVDYRHCHSRDRQRRCPNRGTQCLGVRWVPGVGRGVCRTSIFRSHDLHFIAKLHGLPQFAFLNRSRLGIGQAHHPIEDPFSSGGRATLANDHRGPNSSSSTSCMMWSLCHKISSNRFRYAGFACI